MLAIRMRRLGAKKRPFFRVVVIDSHAAREGRALEVLGHYNPTTVPETFQMDHQRLEHWLTRGAQPSDTLRTLLTRHPRRRGCRGGSISDTANRAGASPDEAGSGSTRACRCGRDRRRCLGIDGGTVG